MKLELTFVALAVISPFVPAHGFPQHGREDPDDGLEPHARVNWTEHPFQPPADTDARGPCPGLNALVNHGFIPRNGSNITLPVVFKAAQDAFNIHREILLTAGKAAIVASDLDDQFSLIDIALHGNIEHDASVSRVDRDLGDNVVFNESIYSTLASSNPGVDYYNTTSAGQVQKARLEQSRAENPKLRNTIKEFQIRTRESLFYLCSMGDAATGVAPKKFVDILFREERLPLEEGWKVSRNPMTHDTSRPLTKQVTEASEWQANEGQCPWLTLAQGAPEDPVNDGSIL
ncbi:Cloroperoxidase [Marasmius fiardii PR-910]|nr:Cloroperoxidase [Marasmius fiardii PR-910]